jgi:hypothetical protein
MAITSAIGISSERHNIAENAERLCGRPEQRAAIEGAGDSAPLSAQYDQHGVGETCCDAAKEEHLEWRQVFGDQLHEAVADHEGCGRGKHGGDADQIGSSPHERGVGQTGRHCDRGGSGTSSIELTSALGAFVAKVLRGSKNAT